MKQTYFIFIQLLIFCCALASCEKEPIKEEPSVPIVNPPKPNTPPEEPTEPVPAKVSPTAYFTFDGNLDDISGNDYYGYGVPEPSFVEGIIPGTKALSFTKRGKQAFVIGDGIIDTCSMTVSFWAKDISDGDIFYLTSFNKNDNGEKMMSLSYRDGHLKFVMGRYNNHYNYNGIDSFTHIPINDGNWHHITLISDHNNITYGAAVTTLYIDGKFMDTVTEKGINGNYAHCGTGTKFVLGGENVPTMQIAHLRMYNSIQLDDNQIKKLYDNDRAGIVERPAYQSKPSGNKDITSGLEAFFPFDGILNDYSGNGHFGYVVPKPSYSEGLISGTKALGFTKNEKQCFVIGDGIIDTKSMSVSFWIKNISDGDIFYLTSTESNDYGEKMMSFSYRDGHFKYVVTRYNNRHNFDLTGNFVHKSIEDEKWHHVVLVSDHNSIKYDAVITSLYIDGKIMDTVSEFGINGNYAHCDTGTKFVIGGENVPSMQIACLRLYDRIQLNKDQVWTIYQTDQQNRPQKFENNTTKQPIYLSSGLTAYFPFDGNFNDISGNDYYGYGNPDPSFTTGLTSSSKALSFTKTEEESFVVGDGLIDSKSMTISLWVKDISDGSIFYVTSSSKGNGGEEMMTLKCQGGFLKYIVCRYYNHHASDATRCFIHQDICDGDWHHIALTSNHNSNGRSISTTKLYVDGRIMDTVTESFSEGAPDNKHFGTGTKFILGGKNVPSMQVAHLRVYDSRELNADEIMSLYKDRH